MQEEIYQKVCEIRAPAKAILCGEHAVVYGEDALAMAIGLHCRGELSIRPKEKELSCIIVALEIQAEPVVIMRPAL